MKRNQSAGVGESIVSVTSNGAGESGGTVAAVDVMMFRYDIIVIDQRC